MALFSSIDQGGVTTFYDSVCGVAVFRAPVGRSFAAWKAESVAHGWPSFRSAEVLQANVKANNATGEVLSACGTHLGSYLPDDGGPRYCIDLACIAGRPQQ